MIKVIVWLVKHIITETIVSFFIKAKLHTGTIRTFHWSFMWLYNTILVIWNKFNFTFINFYLLSLLLTDWVPASVKLIKRNSAAHIRPEATVIATSTQTRTCVHIFRTEKRKKNARRQYSTRWEHVHIFMQELCNIGTIRTFHWSFMWLYNTILVIN